MVYFTIMNETYRQPPMPDGVEEGILKGLYRLRAPLQEDAEAQVHLFGSGAILNEAVQAQSLLAEKFDIVADVWSVTSYKALYRDAFTAERWNRMHPGRKPQTSYLADALKQTKGPFVAVTDYLRALPESIANWLPKRLVALGTDGFGRSDGREHLRAFFEVDAKHIALAALQSLALDGKYDDKAYKQAFKKLGIDPDKADAEEGLGVRS